MSKKSDDNSIDDLKESINNLSNIFFDSLINYIVLFMKFFNENI